MTVSPKRKDAARRALVAGCGPSGALVAVYFAKMGWNVEVYERRPIFRDGEANSETLLRGYDIILQPKGLDAIRTAGVEVDSSWATELTHLVLHGDDVGRSRKFPLLGEHWGVNRELLAGALRAHGERNFPDRITYHFEHRLVGVDFERKTASFGSANRVSERPYDVLIGADGVWSGVRNAMQNRGLVRCSQSGHDGAVWTLEMGGVREMPGADDSWPHCWHLWIKHSPEIVMAVFPTPDGRCRLAVFTERNGILDHLRTGEQVETWLTGRFPEFFAGRKLPTGWGDAMLTQKPNHAGVETDCSSFHARDSVVLLGDAAHSVFPKQGQGCNSALESCRVLAEMVAESGGDLGAALPAFTTARKRDTDAAAVLSRRTFFNPMALVRYMALKQLHRLAPAVFEQPAEELFRHPRTPYRTIQALQARQDRQLVALLVALTVVLAVLLPFLVSFGGVLELSVLEHLFSQVKD